MADALLGNAPDGAREERRGKTDALGLRGGFWLLKWPRAACLEPQDREGGGSVAVLQSYTVTTARRKKRDAAWAWLAQGEERMGQETGGGPSAGAR